MLKLLIDALDVHRVYIVPFDTMALKDMYDVVCHITNAQNDGCLIHVDESGFILCTPPVNLNSVLCDIPLTFNNFTKEIDYGGTVLLHKRGNSICMVCDSYKDNITRHICDGKMPNSALILKYDIDKRRSCPLPITHQLLADELTMYESERPGTGKNKYSRKIQLPRNSDNNQNSTMIYGTKPCQEMTKSQNADNNQYTAKNAQRRDPIKVVHPTMPRNTGVSMGGVGVIVRISNNIKVTFPTISLKGKQRESKTKEATNDRVNIYNVMHNGDDYTRPMTRFPVQASDSLGEDSSELLLNSSQWGSQSRPAIATSSAYGSQGRTEYPRSAPTSRAGAGVLQNGHSHSGYPRLEPRHPEFSSLHTRIGSYTNWPHPRGMQDTNKMARYGLFFTGRGDLVRCFQCGIGMKDWSLNDDPLLEHLRYVPSCPYLADSVDSHQLAHYKTLLSPSTHQYTGAGHTGLPASPTSSPTAPEACIHPAYKEYNIRLSSYSKWPPSKIQTPRMLTDAGFYYTGYEDAVRCYACDGGLQRWDPEDDPWIEHARWFPNCSYVRREKGEDYIQLIQMSMAEDREVDDEAASGITNGMASLMIYHDPARERPTRESEDPVYSPAAQRVIESGFSKAAVKMAISECSQKGIRWNAETLMDVLLEKQDRGETLPPDSPRPESPLPVTVDLPEEDPVSQKERLLSRIMCIMCEVNQANSLFLPCAHHRMCVDCAQDVSVCPMCGKDVREKIKTFMA